MDTITNDTWPDNIEDDEDYRVIDDREDGELICPSCRGRFLMEDDGRLLHFCFPRGGFIDIQGKFIA